MRSQLTPRRGLTVAAALAAGLTAGLTAAPPAAQADVIDLSGQTVTLVHNAAPGGATGLGAQIAAEAWARTMAGSPTMVVQSVEGGALARGIQHVMNARPDGRTLGWVAWSGSTRILDPEELQIPFQDFGIIGGVGGATFFLHARTDIGDGLETTDDFLNLDSFRFGGFAARSAAPMRTAGALDMLGVPWSFVSGFAGDAPQRAAMERGELDGFPATAVIYNQQLRDGPIADGSAIALFYFTGVGEDGNMVEDPLLPGIEPFDAFYRRVMGEDPSGPIWDMIEFHGRVTDPINWLVVAPPGTPEGHLDMLRTSFREAMEDPEFLEGAERIFGQRPVISYFEEVQDIVDEIANAPEELLDTMRDFISRMER